MKKIPLHTKTKRLLADVYTPVGIYLRLRDRFRDTILLESTDHHVSENSYSFICINAISGIEIRSSEIMEIKLPGLPPTRETVTPTTIAGQVNDFISKFEMQPDNVKEAQFAQGLYGYTSYDAVRFFENTPNKNEKLKVEEVFPLIRYRLYQYVIAINHFRDEMIICENVIEGLESELALVESLIRSKDVPVYPFMKMGVETSNITDEEYMQMVEKGIESCHRGDVFQIVLSRRFEQKFRGDEFNVYRALRSVNPSPYLFYFDYGDYRIMGSSPEAQLEIRNGMATVHPIAGTFRRTGNDETDHLAAELLLSDKKENAEHTMLVDLARNDLSRVCDDVKVVKLKEIKYYSHVIHMVSEVSGRVKPGANVFEMLAKTFPAGTLSGAPKAKAVELIANYEAGPRGYYGGAIGFLGFNGSCNHAIMIRSFLSKHNTLICQAGAGVVAASKPSSELEEVNNKLGALKKAISLAEEINKD